MCQKYLRMCIHRAQRECNRHCATHLPQEQVRDLRASHETQPAHNHNASDRANKHVPVVAMDYMYMNETTNGVNNPIHVIHASCSEGVWAVFTKKKDDRAHVKNNVANTIRGLVCSKIVIKSEQEPAIRSMDRNFVESFFFFLKAVDITWHQLGSAQPSLLPAHATQCIQPLVDLFGSSCKQSSL